MKNLLVTVLMMSSLAAFAGDKGNGGDARILGGKYYSLDLVEAGVHKNPYIEDLSEYSVVVNQGVDDYFFNQEFADLKQMIKNKFGELEQIDLVAAHAILLSAKNYHWVFLYDAELVQIHDEFSNVEGDNVQVGIRRNRSIQINANIFNQLDDHNKVAFIFHELISALSQDQSLVKENTKARSLTGSLFNKTLMTQTDIINKLICDAVPCVPAYKETPSYIYVGSRPLTSAYSEDVIFTPKLEFSVRDGLGNAGSRIIRESLLNILDEKFAVNTCEKLWNLADNKKYNLKNRISLTFNSQSSFHSLHFYGKDYTYKTWVNRGDEGFTHFQTLREFSIPYGAKENKKEKTCLAERRNGKCRQWEEQNIEVFHENRDLFMKKCTVEMNQLLEEYKEKIFSGLVINYPTF